MKDYLIVGCGLAGIAFAETALKHGKSVVVFEDLSQNSSWVAGGLINPVILKRLKPLQDAGSQLDLLYEFYPGISRKLGLKSPVLFWLPTLRKFYSIQEQNDWFAASDKPGLSDFLSTQLVHRQFEGIDALFGFGEVLRTGHLDTASLLTNYRLYLEDIGAYRDVRFDYSEIAFLENGVRYQDIEARHLVFAEGFGIHANPFFNDLPLAGTKGELFIIRAPKLKLDVIVNTNVFILPLGNDLFKVGATYNWTDKTDLPTNEAREELIARIREILNCDFEIVEQLAGVRPTVKDRKPLLGTHPQYPHLHILNGLGTRGVMLAPQMAAFLFDHIENGTALAPYLDIKRFAQS